MSAMLVATDGSQLSEHAVAYAISIAAPVNAQVTALYVVQPVHAIVPAPLSEAISEDFAARVEEHAKAAMAFVDETARKAGVPSISSPCEKWPQGRVETAHRSCCDHRRGLSRHQPVSQSC
jgi:nucleotide-binding universal stress UspA family protein